MAIDLSAARLARGAAAGLVASVVMGMYVMIASLYNDTGFFTPLYHIASSIGSTTAMMNSMQAAGSGDSIVFDGATPSSEPSSTRWSAPWPASSSC